MRILRLIAVLLLAAPACFAQLTMESVFSLPHEKVESQLPDAQGAFYYGYAVRLFKEGRKEDAVFWFNVGQLRFRIELKAHPDQDPSGGPALFGALQEQYGMLINVWAGGDVKMWVAQIDRALAWDLAHGNGVISKTEFKKVYDEQRAGLAKLRAQLADQADQIRKGREERGLENRSNQPPEPTAPSGRSSP